MKNILINSLLLLTVIFLFILISGYKNIDSECWHYTNNTRDTAYNLPFTDKCIGITNYIEEDTGRFKRGIVIR